MTYKAVGFDYGGVITGEPSTRISKTIASLLDVSEEKYITAYYHHNIALNSGEITWEELWKAVLNELNRTDKFQSLTDYLKAQKFGDPDKKILKLILNLRKNGFKTGLLSNNTLSAAKEMRKSGLQDYFDAFDISAETGMVKPEEEAFLLLTRQLEVEMSQLVFIDDSKKSLSTASSVGFTPILYEDYDSAIRQLNKMGINTS